MRIERISDNQIRCTLSKRDLIERHLKISELAYGSDRAKELFRDMMEQANIDFGFEAEDIPLMIEAIPTSKESLVLVITKVDDPQEFDERFANFNLPDAEEEDVDADFADIGLEDEENTSVNFDDLMDCFDQLYEKNNEEGEGDGDAKFIPLSEALAGAQTGTAKPSKQKKSDNIHERVKVFSFVSINPIIEAAHRVTSGYNGKNTIWKDTAGKKYYLLLNRGNGKHAFHAACSTISEYGSEENVTYATQDYFNEHYKIIIKDKALFQLSKL